MTIEIVDGQKFEERIKETEAGKNANIQDRSWFRVGNLIPTEVPSISHLGFWDLPTTDERDFVIRFYAQNGMWVQKHKARLVNGRWAEATRVVRKDSAGNLVVLHEEMSRDFPRDEQGQIDWVK